METIVERPAGLDVHKAQVTACVRTPAATGGREEHFAGDYFQRRDPERTTKRLVGQLEALGHRVTLEGELVAA